MAETDLTKTSAAEVIIIAAMAGPERVIGRNGQLPWPPQPVDMERFQALTWNHTLILGRKTWDIELHRQPLPHRPTIVVSRDAAILAPQYTDVRWAGSLAAALQLSAHENQVFVAGGAGLYAEALPLADRLELTLIPQAYPGDTFFPDYAPYVGSRYQLLSEAIHETLRFHTYGLCP